jgi:hypothetical protein
VRERQPRALAIGPRADALRGRPSGEVPGHGQGIVATKRPRGPVPRRLDMGRVGGALDWPLVPSSDVGSLRRMKARDFPSRPPRHAIRVWRYRRRCPWQFREEVPSDRVDETLGRQASMSIGTVARGFGAFRTK